MIRKIKNITIVGGGSAGWMTASTIIKLIPNISVTVIESPNVPTVGVGESTVGGIRRWMRMIGIEDKDFIKATDASYKLAIKFNDFYQKGNTWYYPFGEPYIEKNIFGKNDWFVKKSLKNSTPEYDMTDCYYPQMALVNQNKISFNPDIPNFSFFNDSAFHFDAAKFGIYLRDFICVPNGVHHIVADVVDTEVNDRYINNVKLSTGDVYTADLFIDCTGFNSLLLGQALEEPFISYEDILPNNRAWATKIPYIDKHKELNCYTECTAVDNGWIWNIPLWSCVGTGYVYSDTNIAPDIALADFKEFLRNKGQIIENFEFKDIKMQVGRHENLWVNNVVAIGLSAAFIEPLESTGLVTVYEFAINLCRALRRGAISRWDIDEYNATSIDQFDNLAQFVAMHYAFSHRNDTLYWQTATDRSLYSKTKSFTKLNNQNLIHNSIFSKFHHNELPLDNGMLCLAAGMNWYPTDNVILSGFDYNIEDNHVWIQTAINNLDQRKKSWNESVKNEQLLHDFLYNNFYKS